MTHMVILDAGGDLTSRYLIPALAELATLASSPPALPSPASAANPGTTRASDSISPAAPTQRRSCHGCTTTAVT